MRSFRLIIGVLALGLVSTTVRAEDDVRTLKNIADRVVCHQQIRIVAFGSSTTFGYGSSSPDKTYPAKMQAFLKKNLPQLPEPLVINAGKNGDTTAMNNRRMQKDVLDYRPDLVIWNLGVNEAFDGTAISDFHSAAVDGIKALLENNIDVVLIDPQDTPNFRKSGHADEYTKAVREVGRELHVGVIKRYDLMKEWLKAFGPAIIYKDDFHMSDVGYELLGREAADFIVKGAKLPKKMPETLTAAQQARCAALAAVDAKVATLTH